MHCLRGDNDDDDLAIDVAESPTGNMSCAFFADGISLITTVEISI